MLRYAVNFEGPIAIRYPRGEAYEGLREYRKKIEYAKSEVIFEESQIAIFAVGNMVETAVEVRERLKQQGYACSLINARSVKPLDEEMLLKMAEKHTLFVTLEENICRGGYGEAVLSFLNSQDVLGHLKVLTLGIQDRFVEHGSVGQLRKALGLDAETVVDTIMKTIENS